MSRSKVYLLSLGCSKNQVDSEIMAGALKLEGYVLTEDPAKAQIIIVNTCGFIEAARQEAIAALLDMAAYKQNGCCQTLAAVGCMVEKFGPELKEALPEVDLFIGVGQYDQIASLLQEKTKPAAPEAGKLPQTRDIYTLRDLPPGGGSAYLKIAEGCDNRCAYCLIPQIRGPYRSRPMEDILAEAQRLAEAGFAEVVLIAQDSTCYGRDLYGQPRLPELLEAIAQLPFAMVRVLYVYPDLINDQLIRVMGAHGNICRYLDMPIQHCSRKVLRAMHRRGDPASLLEKIAQLRAALPDLVLRTTVMVGFPGETEKDFAQLLDFLGQARFDWLGAFPYFREPDTPAENLPDQVAEEVKEQRVDAVMRQAADITEAALAKYIGRVLTVLAIEPEEELAPGWSVGRSQYQAPEVDGLIYFSGAEAQPGQLYQVRITGHDIYDLEGEALL